MITTYGNPSAILWVILDELCSSGIKKGSITLDSQFFELNKWLHGLDFHLRLFDPTDLSNELRKGNPPFFLALGDAPLNYLCPETRQKSKTQTLQKWAGSILSIPQAIHENYVIGTFPPRTIFSQYELRDIVVSIDIGKLRDEIEYYKKYKMHRALPPRKVHIIESPGEGIDLLMSKEFMESEYVSVDIETLRKRNNSPYFEADYPGLVYTIGLAPSPRIAAAMPIWSFEDTRKTAELLKVIADLLREKIVIGQNFFNFDSYFLENLGFYIPRIQDIRIRHHILWPELSHRLMFMTRQYTREPYYKDDGKNFIPRDRKSLRRLLHYNGLDAAVTYEVFQAQEEEFKERPHLK